MTPKWACVARLGSIGDNFLASSVLPLLKRDGYMVDVMAQEPASVIFENNPNVDKLTLLKNEDLPNNPTDWQKYFARRANEYDKFYPLSHSIESHVVFHPDSTGFLWPPSYRRMMADRSYLALTHDLCEVPHEYDPHFFPTEAEKEDAEAIKVRIAPLGQKVVGWVVAGSRVDKLYPYASNAIARIIKELDARVLMLGAPEHKDWVAQIETAVNTQNGSLQGLYAGFKAAGSEEHPVTAALPLRRSLSWAQECDLVIGPDTGMMWSVATREMPKIMLLGHASPKNITHGWLNTTTLHADPARVPSWPCHQLHNDLSTCHPNKEGTGAACISDISVETIVSAARNLLGGSLGC